MTQVIIDFGPLAALQGVWQGNKGKDVAPEPDGTEYNDYYETLTFSPSGNLSNAETEELVTFQYRQLVQRSRDDKVIHDESGYLSWDAEQQKLILSFAIPRGIGVVAGGVIEQQADALIFRAQAGEQGWPIAQSPFMDAHAKTLSFTREMTLAGDQLSYRQTTLVDIYGKRFEHTDENLLTRIG